MSELMLPVTCNGTDREYPFKVLPGGYVTRYAVLVDGTEVIFETDDQGEIRALIYDKPDQAGQLRMEPGLLEAISTVIMQITG